MTLTDLVTSGMQAIDGLEKRMTAKSTGDLAEKLGAATLAAHVSRIEQRIARLDQQRSATLARIDAALESEHAALSTIRKMADDMPAAARGKQTKPRPAPASRASTGKKTATKKPASVKPAKPA